MAGMRKEAAPPQALGGKGQEVYTKTGDHCRGSVS